MIRAVMFCAIVLLSACGQAPQTYRDLDQLGSDYQRGAQRNATSDTCAMAAHRDLIGRDQASIDPASLPRGARIVCLNCPLTMDHSPERLNLMLDADGKVASLHCG